VLLTVATFGSGAIVGRPDEREDNIPFVDFTIHATTKSKFIIVKRRDLINFGPHICLQTISLLSRETDETNSRCMARLNQKVYVTNAAHIAVAAMRFAHDANLGKPPVDTLCHLVPGALVVHPTKGKGHITVVDFGHPGDKPYLVVYDRGETCRYSKDSAKQLELVTSERSGRQLSRCKPGTLIERKCQAVPTIITVRDARQRDSFPPAHLYPLPDESPAAMARMQLAMSSGLSLPRVQHRFQGVHDKFNQAPTTTAKASSQRDAPAVKEMWQALRTDRPVPKYGLDATEYGRSRSVSINSRHDHACSTVDTKRMQNRVLEALFGLRPADSEAPVDSSSTASRRSSSMGRELPGDSTLHEWQAELREWKVKHLHGGAGPGKYLGRRVIPGPLLDAARLDVAKGSELQGLGINYPPKSGSISARF
jgi:hypothetical protein